MSIITGSRQFDREIMEELKTVSKNKKLKPKHIMEWNTNEQRVEVRNGEQKYHLSKCGIWVVVNDKK